MRRLTLGYLTVSDVPPTRLVELAAAAGFTSVGLRVTGRRPGDPYEPVVGNVAAIELIRRQLADTGLALSNISSYHLYPEIGFDQYRPVFETTAALGAANMVCGCYDADESRFADAFARLSEEATRFGIRLSLEFVPFSKCPTLAQAQRAVAATGGKAAILIDNLHLQRSGGAPRDIHGVDARDLAFAQICDAPAELPAGTDLATEARTGRLFPGDGALPIDAFLDALPPDIEIEVETPVAALAALPPLERLRQSFTRVSRVLQNHDDKRNRRGKH